MIRWGNGPVCVIRKEHEELCAVDYVKRKDNESWQESLWKGAFYGRQSLLINDLQCEKVIMNLNKANFSEYMVDVEEHFQNE